jgi:hypothetical protein
LIELNFIISRSLGNSIKYSTPRHKKSNTSSKYRGVSAYKGKWVANIPIFGTGKLKYLGIYDREEDAALVYNEAAIERDGDKAILNVIGEENERVPEDGFSG